MEKLKFTFSVKTHIEDLKSNMIVLTSIMTHENKCYAMPEQYQLMEYHKELTATTVFKQIQTTLKKKGQTRRMWIKLSEATLKLYRDEEGNMVFKNYVLEELRMETPATTTDRQKTVFITQEVHYQWTCLPFGLKTAPAIFQRILSNIIRKHKLSDFCANYIDDILVFSKDFVGHMEHMSKLLEAIMKEGFRLKFSKCIFAADSVKYLGPVIRYNSVSPLKDNLVSIKNFPTPETRKNIR